MNVCNTLPSWAAGLLSSLSGVRLPRATPRDQDQYPRRDPVSRTPHIWDFVRGTVYPKKYAHDFVVLCFVVVMQSFIINSHDVCIHIYQGCFAGTGAIVRLPQCQWSKPDGYRKISQCITTTKHSKAKTVCIFLGIYCRLRKQATVTHSIEYSGILVGSRHICTHLTSFTHLYVLKTTSKMW